MVDAGSLRNETGKKDKKAGAESKETLIVINDSRTAGLAITYALIMIQEFLIVRRGRSGNGVSGRS
jgi:hypothetical protein